MHSPQAIINARLMFPRGLYQPSGSFRFSVDGLLLASFMASFGLDHSRALVGDFGAGCGVVGLAYLLKHPEAQVIGFEKQEPLVAAANGNARLLGYGERYACLKVDLTLDNVLHGDFFERAVRKNAGINARLMLENMPAEIRDERVSANLPPGNLMFGNLIRGNLASGNLLPDSLASGSLQPGKLKPGSSCSGAFGSDKSGYDKSGSDEWGFGTSDFGEFGLGESASNESVPNVSGYGGSCLGERDWRAGDGGFDIIVANPPYRVLGHGRLPRSPMRQQALFAPAGTVEKFCEAAHAMLAPRGFFGVVFPAGEEDRIRRAMADVGFRLERVLRVHGREGKPATLVLLAGRKITAETSCPAGGDCCTNHNPDGWKWERQGRKTDNGGTDNGMVEDSMPSRGMPAKVMSAKLLSAKELAPKAPPGIGRLGSASGYASNSALGFVSESASGSISGAVFNAAMADDYKEETSLILYDKDNRLSDKAIDFCPYLG